MYQEERKKAGKRGSFTLSPVLNFHIMLGWKNKPRHKERGIYQNISSKLTNSEVRSDKGIFSISVIHTER